MTVPYWIQDTIFYQIFPDRFNNGDATNDPTNIQPWGAEPTVRGFQGGDFRGIIHKFDYLLDLGINAIYLNPIFTSASNHRYHTNDYYHIDPTLGTMEDFHALIDVAHRNNVRVILDGVFNHSGRGFFAFNDVLENGPESRYKDWYHINSFPVDAFGGGKSTTYKAWWDIKDLPKFNTVNPYVRKFLMEVSRYWIQQGADGWRLDVPAEIDDDDFWAEFRQVVKSVNSDAYTVGEIWEVDPRWVGDSHFDGLMHYPLREVILDLLTEELKVTAFADLMESFHEVYPKENLYAMYLPLGSHDTKRLLTKLEGDLAKVKLAYLVQFANPGAPAIYYGDEVGMEGGKDPENRRAFPWDEKEWNTELRRYIQDLIVARKRQVALRRGDFQRVAVSDEFSYYAFSRSLGEEQVLVVINASDVTHQARIPVADLGWEEGYVVQDVITKARYGVAEEAITITLPPWSGSMVG
jgi:glycosidase